MIGIGRSLVVFGAVIIAIGLLLMFEPKIPFLGKLPGDIHLKKENYEVYIPLATSFLLSLVISIVIWIFHYFKK